MTAPKQALAIKNDVDGIITNLIERGLGDDANFSVLDQSGDVTDVTFRGAEHISFAMDDIDYTDLHRELSSRRSYNLKLLDGGLLQLMYRFRGDNLIQHRLAYYSSPNLRAFQDDPDAYMRDELFVDIISRRIIPFPLRFDFDSREGVYRDVSHPKSHLTFGDIKDCRVPVTSPLTPRWFAEFILRNFYQTERHDFVGRLPKHVIHFGPTISENERQMIHLAIPAEA